MKIPLLFALLAGSVVSQYAFADVCKNVNGVPSSNEYDLTTTDGRTKEAVGKTVQLEKSELMYGRCVPPARRPMARRNSYVSPYPVVRTSGSWKYLKLDRTAAKAECSEDSSAGDIYRQ